MPGPITNGTGCGGPNSVVCNFSITLTATNVQFYQDCVGTDSRCITPSVTLILTNMVFENGDILTGVSVTEALGFNFNNTGVAGTQFTAHSVTLTITPFDVDCDSFVRETVNFRTGPAPEVTGVPEPSSLAALGVGLAGLVGWYRRRGQRGTRPVRV